MWRKNEGHVPTGDVVQVKLRDDTVLPVNERFPKEGRRWWFAKDSPTQSVRDLWTLSDIIEYDDGQEPEGQGNDFMYYGNPVHYIPAINAAPRCVMPVERMQFAEAHKIADDALRTFETGATRHNDSDKYDYEGFLSPIALEAFAAYMHVNRRTVDGGLRDSDNWQKGIPVTAYMKSKWRHDFEMWKAHRGYGTDEGELAAACGVLFNTMGWIHEKAKADPEWFERELEKFKQYRAAEIAARGK